jgi:hypothetical protein
MRCASHNDGFLQFLEHRICEADSLKIDPGIVGGPEPTRAGRGATISTENDRERGARMTLTVQEMSDRIEIEDVLARYCYAVDDRDWESYRTVFTADAVIDDVVTGGIRSGVEEHITYLKRALTHIRTSQHTISTVLIDVNGESARAVVHCVCPMVVEMPGGATQTMLLGVRYRDQLARQSDAWRISELVEEKFWHLNVPEGFKF